MREITRRAGGPFSGADDGSISRSNFLACAHVFLAAEAAGEPASGAHGCTIGIVLKGYPRLSETFIAQELLALEQRGLSLALYSLRRPTDRASHAGHVSSRISARRPAPRLARMAHRATLAGIPRGASDLVARPAARPDAQPRTPLRAGAGARVRTARGRHAPARAFPAHARVGSPLRGDAARHWLELLRARQGHLDDS